MQRERCSKTLLDDEQCKHAWRSRNGRLKQPARKTKKVVVSSPSGRGQKERLVREREQQTVTVQSRRDAKFTPRTRGREKSSPNECLTSQEVQDNGGLASRITKREGLGILSDDRGIGSPTNCSIWQRVQDNGGLASRVTKKEGLGTLADDCGIGSPADCSIWQSQRIQDNGGLASRVTKVGGREVPPLRWLDQPRDPW